MRNAPLIHALVQAVALAALVVGIYLLAGLAWAITVAGAATLVVSVLAELGSDLGMAPMPAGPDLREVP